MRGRASPTGHRLRSEEGIHDRLFRRVDHRVEERVDAVVDEHLERSDAVAAFTETAVPCCPGEDEVAARVLSRASRARDSERGSLRPAVRTG